MKIALYVHGFYPSHYHGTEAYTLLLAKALAARGHQPIVVTATFQDDPAQPQFIEERSWEGIPVISIDKNQRRNVSIRDTYHQPAMREVHRDILQRMKPDVMHVCHLVNHTSVLLEVGAELEIPIVATFTDFFGICYTNILESADGSLCSGPDQTRANCIACHLKATVMSSDLAQDWRRYLYPRILPYVSRLLAEAGRWSGRALTIKGFRPADLIERPELLAKAMRAYHVAITPTQYLKQVYERAGFSGPLMLSRFGVDIDRSAKPTLERRGVIRLGYIGQIARHKGVHVLVEAFRAANKRNLSLTIWGSHDQQPAYFEHLRDQSRGFPVRFPGAFPAPEIVGILGQLDALVIPSIWSENCPLILLQALATHTPVIISDVPGMTEFVREGIDSFRFPRGDVGALSAILSRIADDSDLIAKMSLHTEYQRTSQDMAQDVLAAYQFALSGRTA